MTFLVAKNPPIAGAFTVRRYAGFGIKGADIPSSGENGSSPVLNDGISPSAEYNWVVASSPLTGSLTIYPDMSYLHTGIPVGASPWSYSLYEYGALKGTWTVTDYIGSNVITTIPAQAAANGGICTINTEVTGIAPGASFTSAPNVSFGNASTPSGRRAPGAAFLGDGTLSPGRAFGPTYVYADGAAFTRIARMQAGWASNGHAPRVFVKDGGVYHPCVSVSIKKDGIYHRWAFVGVKEAGVYLPS